MTTIESKDALLYTKPVLGSVWLPAILRAHMFDVSEQSWRASVRVSHSHVSHLGVFPIHMSLSTLVSMPTPATRCVSLAGYLQKAFRNFSTGGQNTGKHHYDDVISEETSHST